MSDLSLKLSSIEKLHAAIQKITKITNKVDCELLQHSQEKTNVLTEISVNFHVYFHSAED